MENLEQQNVIAEYLIDDYTAYFTINNFLELAEDRFRTDSTFYQFTRFLDRIAEEYNDRIQVRRNIYHMH